MSLAQYFSTGGGGDIPSYPWLVMNGCSEGRGELDFGVRMLVTDEYIYI